MVKASTLAQWSRRWYIRGDIDPNDYTREQFSKFSPRYKEGWVMAESSFKKARYIYNTCLGAGVVPLQLREALPVLEEEALEQVLGELEPTCYTYNICYRELGRLLTYAGTIYSYSDLNIQECSYFAENLELDRLLSFRYSDYFIFDVTAVYQLDCQESIKNAPITILDDLSKDGIAFDERRIIQSCTNAKAGRCK